MIESELFGHEKGAFTGAEKIRKGIFEIASGGTLFLDEIGTLAPHMQSKLLGVLDDGIIRRLGGHREIEVETRVVAATNLDIETAIHRGAFRDDLFYRLSVIHVHMPPLRERAHDIPALCHHFIREQRGEPVLELPAAEVRALMAYTWPGNVRELRNTLERAIILRRGNILRPSALLAQNAPLIDPLADADRESNDILPLEVVVRRHIRNVLERFAQNRTQAARALGISRSTLKRKLKSMSIHQDGVK